MHETALVIGGGAIGVAAAISLKARAWRRHAGGTQRDPAQLSRARPGYHVRAPEDVAGLQFDLVVDAVGYDATRAAASARPIQAA
jgi:L-gulonate 5-dehydrogenase